MLTVLRSVERVGRLPEPVLEDLASEMRSVALADGEVLVRQDDFGSSLCIVVSGALAVSWRDRTGALRELPDVLPGGVAGGGSILSDTAALATVQARGATTLLQLPREGFARLSQRNPGGTGALVEALRPYVHHDAMRVALRQSETLSDLDPDLLASLESELEPVTLTSGDVLIRAGEVSDTVYLVISGRLRVVSGLFTENERVHAELGSGETIGEMALITKDPRSADVYAIRDTQLARLSRGAIERLLARHPSAALIMLARGPVTRVRNMNNGRSRVSPAAAFVLVPASPGVNLDAFADGFLRGLLRLGPATRVTSQIVDAQLGRPGAAQTVGLNDSSQLIEWLAKQELDHRFIVYQADASRTAWTERAIRQADHVVLVADSTADPAPGETERDVLGHGLARRIGRTLVLLYNTGQSPSGTVRWFKGRTLDRHLHVRVAETGDFERAARLLTGHGIGLALGGGFARGLAHVGVLRACRELGVPIDVLGGSSMGAMIGAQHLLGWDADRIVRDISKGLAKSFDDMTIPFLAFKRGGKSSRMMRTFFGDTCIEDLWLPFFCTSSNLNRADLKVHTTGPLFTAVLATTRAPGVFPPVVIDGELHVDGGLINNVPVDVMMTIANQGPVIGVDVSPPHELGRVTDYGDDVSGWQAIWSRFNPTREKRSYRPSILLVLMRLIEFGGISYRVRVSGSADLCISPDVLRFKRNDFQRATELVETGYQAARDSLTTWLTALSERPDPGRFRGLPIKPAARAPGFGS